jgi:hypothetical protein
VEIHTIVSVADNPPGRKGIPNITLQDCRFFGKPNFSGIENQFKDSRRQFTVVIPNEVADQLREIGYNVKTSLPTPEQEAEGMEKISHLKVMVDDGSMVAMGPAGTPPSIISTDNFMIVDMTRFETWDCELRGWNYNEEEVKAGREEPLYSARLVQFVGTMRPNILAQKYGNLT